MNPIDVICGIIIQNGKVLVAQRGFNMTLPYKWEFPGGKKDECEGDAQCLERELLEELNLKVIVRGKFAQQLHNYDTFGIRLIAYMAEIVGGTILMFEHSKVEWLAKHQLEKLNWAAADIPIMLKLVDSEYL